MEIMEKNIGPTFLTRKEFREIVKENLCDSILKNSISMERAIFKYSLGIFVALVNNFREHLKTEIAIFVDSVFMKMLESTNSTYIHKHLALQVFYKIVSRAMNVLEFYVNYDCDINSTNTTEKIIEMICKVAQGKYTRAEFAAIIQPNQEYNLRGLAIESIVNMVRNLVNFTEEMKVKVERDNKKEENGNDETELDIEESKDHTTI